MSDFFVDAKLFRRICTAPGQLGEYDSSSYDPSGGTRVLEWVEVHLFQQGIELERLLAYAPKGKPKPVLEQLNKATELGDQGPKREKARRPTEL